MDSHDNDDSFDLYDPDYGDIDLIPWDEPNLSDRDEEDNIAGSGVDAADSREPLSLAELQYLGAVDWEMPRPSTICLYHEALDLRMQHVHTVYSQLHADAQLWSYLLEDTFMRDKLCFPPYAPPSVDPRSAGLGGSNALRQTWLLAMPLILPSLHNLTLWVRHAEIVILSDDDLDIIYHWAWNLLCATLSYPWMHAAFEAFTAAPVASPEVARFHLAGVGLAGPPPPAHGPPFLVEWRPEGCNLACDAHIDIESVAISVVYCLEVSTKWVLDAPVSILDPAILGEVSLTCWELFIASLCIPQACAEFEALCADPPALWEAAGLMPVPPVLEAATIDNVLHCPHPRSNQQRVRH